MITPDSVNWEARGNVYARDGPRGSGARRNFRLEGAGAFCGFHYDFYVITWLLFKVLAAREADYSYGCV